MLVVLAMIISGLAGLGGAGVDVGVGAGLGAGVAPGALAQPAKASAKVRRIMTGKAAQREDIRKFLSVLDLGCFIFLLSSWLRFDRYHISGLRKVVSGHGMQHLLKILATDHLLYSLHLGLLKARLQGNQVVALLEQRYEVKASDIGR